MIKRGEILFQVQWWKTLLGIKPMGLFCSRYVGTPVSWNTTLLSVALVIKKLSWTAQMRSRQSSIPCSNYWIFIPAKSHKYMPEFCFAQFEIQIVFLYAINFPSFWEIWSLQKSWMCFMYYKHVIIKYEHYNHKLLHMGMFEFVLFCRMNVLVSKYDMWLVSHKLTF